MALVKTITDVCDICGKDASEDRIVQEHTLRVDNRAEVVLDACDSCWAKKSVLLERLMGLGRSKKRAENQRRELALVGA